MKYFKLLFDFERNVFPQVDFINQSFAHKLSSSSRFEGGEGLQMKLEPEAKLTNVMSQATISASGLVLDLKVLEMIKDFKSMENSLFPIQFNNQQQYFWLNFIGEIENFDFLDYASSIFYYRSFGFREGTLIINDVNDLKLKKKEVGSMSSIHLDSIKLKPTFDYDIFSIPYFDRSIFVSERLKNEIDRKDISGLLFELANIERQE